MTPANTEADLTDECMVMIFIIIFTTWNTYMYVNIQDINPLEYKNSYVGIYININNEVRALRYNQIGGW